MRYLRPLSPSVAMLFAAAIFAVPARAQQGQKKSAAAGAKATPTPDATPVAAPVATPTPEATPTPVPLSAAQMTGAAAFDEMTVPTPGELFTALGKQIKANWSGEFRPPIPTAFGDRAQIALNLGGLIADGYIAVEAQDGQRVKNVGKDIIKLAAALGVAREILDRGKTITQFADDNDWNQLKEELEATQNEVRQAMDAKRDEDLTTLVTVGGWARGTQVVANVVGKNFNENAASVLRQPALVAYLRGKLADLPPKEHDKPLIQNLEKQMEAIEKLLSFPAGATATKDDVKKLTELCAAMIEKITTKGVTDGTSGR